MNDLEELSPFISGDDNTSPTLYNNIFNTESHKNALGDLKEIDTDIDATQDDEKIRNLTGVIWNLLPSVYNNWGCSVLIIF